MIAILEPFANQSQMYSCRMQLLMDNGHSNCNNKIWLFSSSDVNCNMVDIDHQKITC